VVGNSVNISGIALLIAMLLSSGRGDSSSSVPMSKKEIEKAVTLLRGAYAAFNRGDIDSAVSGFDLNIEWVEPPEFPGGGAYQGREGAKRYLAQSRAGCRQVISEPVKFIPVGDRIVVFVHARVLPKESDQWQQIDLADVYTFKAGRAIAMRAFAQRDDALKWVGAKESESATP
jgi:ketosteroid isomerase-like protein